MPAAARRKPLDDEAATTPKVGANRGNAGKGRPKGSLNKTTASVKQALTDAFEQRGGVTALLEWATKEPTEFYKLWAKMLPTEVTGADGQPLTPGQPQLFLIGGQKVEFQ